MVKLQQGIRLTVPSFCLPAVFLSVLHAGLDLKDSLHPVSAGYCLGNGDDQIRHFDQLHQDLGHIVDQGRQFALGDSPRIHLNGSAVEQRDNSSVDNHIRHRIHQARYLSREKLHLIQGFRTFFVLFYLRFLLIEGPDYPGAGKIFPGAPQHLIQPVLHPAVHGDIKQHNPEHHQTQKGDNHHEHKCCPDIHGKGHDHGAEYHKGGPQQQAEGQVHAVLHLVHIACHPGHHGSGSQGVNLCIGKALYMGEQTAFYLRGKAHRRFGREILGRNRTEQPDYSQHYHYSSHPENIPVISLPNAPVNNGRHHQGNKQFKGGLQHLK